MKTDYKEIIKNPKNKKRLEWIMKNPDKIESWNNFHEIEFDVDVNTPEGIKIWKFPYNEKISKKIIDAWYRYSERKRVREYMEKQGCSKKEIEKELGDTDPSKPDYFPY